MKAERSSFFAPGEAQPSYKTWNWKINDCGHAKKHNKYFFNKKNSAISNVVAAASKERTTGTLPINMLNQKNRRRWWHAEYRKIVFDKSKSLLWQDFFLVIICLLLWLTGVVNPLNLVAKQTNSVCFLKTFNINRSEWKYKHEGDINRNGNG